MPIELPVVILVAVVALMAAAMVAQRTAEHADRQAGRQPVAGGWRRGPIGAVFELLDESVAAYMIRSRLGRTTLTRPERHVERERATAIAQADAIREARTGDVLDAHAPTRLVVAGAAGQAMTPIRSMLSVELLAAGLGLAVVVLVVIGIWPRETGAVLSATGTLRPEATATASPSTLPTVPP